MHVPEAALRSGGLGNFRRVLRVRVNRAHREVTKSERELIPERLLQSIDDFDSGAAIRTFEVAVLHKCKSGCFWPANVIARRHRLNQSRTHS
jgi:hypothetical protein